MRCPPCRLLADSGRADISAAAILNHGAIKPLRKKRDSTDAKHGPSYLPSPLFTSVLLDTLGSADDAVGTAVDRLPPGDLRSSLQLIVRDAEGRRDKVRAGIEHWYDSTMERASGWYKRTTQVWLLAIGIVLAFSMNADTRSSSRRTPIRQAGSSTGREPPSCRSAGRTRPATRAAFRTASAASR